MFLDIKCYNIMSDFLKLNDKYYPAEFKAAFEGIVKFANKK